MSKTTLPTEPYVGLMPFREEDAAFFFGREAERDIIIANLMASRLTLLYGPSGVGKTSVLHAGVAHHLAEQSRTSASGQGKPEYAVVVFGSWRDDPVPELLVRVGEAVSRTVGYPIDDPGPVRSLESGLRAWTERLGGDLLIILDQFEEFFLYHEGEEGEGAWADELPGAIRQPDLRVNFLISIREDGLARLDQFKGRIPNLFGNYLRVEHLDVDAARDAIEQPLAKFNRVCLPPKGQHIAIEPTLVDAVLEQVQTGQVLAVQGGLGTAGGMSGGSGPIRIEAPYLQLVMTRLWDEELAAGSRVLRLETLEHLGGAERIVRTHLDKALSTLPEEQQAVAASAFRYLVTPSGTKITHTLPDLAEYAGVTPAELEPVLRELSDPTVRVLRPVAPPPSQPNTPRYEIFHDVLAAPILDWRVRHERVEAERRLKREKQEADAKAHKERRRATMFKTLAFGSVVLALVAIGSALFALELRREALDSRRQARQQAALAVSRSLAVQSISFADSRLPRSLLLAVEAVKAADSLDARRALLEGLQHEPHLLMYLLDARSQDDLGGDRASITDVAFAADGGMVAIGTDAGVILFDPVTGERLGSRIPARQACGHPFTSVAFSPDSRTLAVGNDCNGVMLWDTTSREPLSNRLPISTKTFRLSFPPRLAFSADGDLLAVGDTSQVRIWDARTHAIVNTLPARNVIAVSFTTADTVAVADQAGVRLLDVRTGGSLGEIGSHEGRGATFASDGQTVAMRDEGGVGLWDVQTQERKGFIATSRSYSIVFAPVGNALAIGERDGISLWDTSRVVRIGHLPSLARMGPPAFGRAAFGPDGTTLAVGNDFGVTLWSLSATHPLSDTLETSSSATAVAFHGNGTLAIGQVDGVSLWDMMSQQRIDLLPGHDVTAVGFSGDGDTMAVGDADGVSLWAMPRLQPVGEIHRRGVGSVAFDPTGSSIAIGDREGVGLWDVRTQERVGDPLVTLNDFTPRPADATCLPSAVAFSPDGRFVAIATYVSFRGNCLDLFDHPDVGVGLWDAHTGRKIARLPISTLDEEPGAYAVAFSPHGELLAASDLYGKISLWDVATRQQRGNAMTDPFSSSAQSLAFSPDGATLASGKYGAIELWDVSSQQHIGKSFPLDGAVSSLAFAPDGSTLASADGHLAVLLDLRITSWLILACELANRNLTTAEWRGFLDRPYRATCGR